MNIQQLFRRKSVKMILSHARENIETGKGMKRDLNVRDLTSLGIAAIIGAGIFSTIGTAAATGGPAVSLLFVFSAIACGFSAMCYAQFASTIPVSGSAYTYVYASFGELIAWIIGWDLIMEYAVGNIAVAISWSGYFSAMLDGLGLHIPEFMGIDYLSASRGFKEATAQLASGIPLTELSYSLQKAYTAWTTAPAIGDFRLIADIPAFAIVVLITWLVFRGIHESKMASNIMVVLKLAILLLVIGIGSFYVKPENWSPFAPNGIAGVLKGVSGVFFAYIGFDAISTTAEECKNPQRDLPLSMIYSLVITTVLYVAISLVLTGMVFYGDLGVSDPLAFVFNKLNLNWLSGIIAFSAIIAMASVLLVFQVGQPRIWMSMSRDGLLPPVFSKLHKRYRTPAFSTLVTGILVAVPSLFMNLTEVTDLTSIGTLFAFILVSGGILILDGGKREKSDEEPSDFAGRFRVPYFNSRYYLPVIWIVVLVVYSFIADKPGSESIAEQAGISLSTIIYGISALVLTIVAVVRQLSLIPVMGLLTNFYLMTQLTAFTWKGFGIWLLVGLLLYFTYGFKHSRLNKIKMAARNRT